MPEYILKSTLECIENGIMGEYGFMPDQYPELLSFIQNTCNPIIKAISIVEGEEDFWPTFWGSTVLDSTNEKSCRIFIFQKFESVGIMRDVLKTHDARYQIRIGTTKKIPLNPAKTGLDCILFYRQIGQTKKILRFEDTPSFVGFYKREGLRKTVSLSSKKEHIKEYLTTFNVIYNSTHDLSSLRDKTTEGIAKFLFEQ